MKGYNDDNNKIYGRILATTSISAGSNADFSIIATLTYYNGNILWYDINYAFNESNLE